MPSKARIRLWSTNVDNLNYVVGQIRTIAEKTGVNIRGPIPLPRNTMLVPVRDYLMVRGERSGKNGK